MKRIDCRIDKDQWFFIPTFCVMKTNWPHDWKYMFIFAWLSFRFGVGFKKRK